MKNDKSTKTLFDDRNIKVRAALYLRILSIITARAQLTKVNIKDDDDWHPESMQVK